VADNLASQGRRNSLSLAALVCGVVGILVFFLGGPILDLWPVGALIGAVAAALGFAARKREPEGRKLALIGLVLGLIVVVWFVVFILLLVAGVVTDE
jgi:drug/metabolite transporter (DMT)-like permease